MRLANAKNRLPQSLNSFPRLRNNVQKIKSVYKKDMFFRCEIVKLSLRSLSDATLQMVII